MVLATHAFAGGILAAAITANPAVAFGIGVISHFLLDAIPHWDYTLSSSRKDPRNPLADDIQSGKALIGDLAKIGADFLFGIRLYHVSHDGAFGVRVPYCIDAFCEINSTCALNAARYFERTCCDFSSVIVPSASIFLSASAK